MRADDGANGHDGRLFQPQVLRDEAHEGCGLRTAARVAHKARLGLVNAALLFYQLKQGNICPCLLYTSRCV